MGWRTTESYTGSGLSAVWAASREVAWVSGNDGALQRWDGTRFYNVPQRETTAGLLSIHAAENGSSVWAVGDRGTLLRWNGVAWEPTPIDSVDEIQQVALIAFPDPAGHPAGFPNFPVWCTADGAPAANRYWPPPNTAPMSAPLPACNKMTTTRKTQTV